MKKPQLNMTLTSRPRSLEPLDHALVRGLRGRDEKTPTEHDFDIPTSEATYESMVERFKTVGLTQKEADEAIKARTTAFNRACREFKKKQLEQRKKDGVKTSTRAHKPIPKNNSK